MATEYIISVGAGLAVTIVTAIVFLIFAGGIQNLWARTCFSKKSWVCGQETKTGKNHSCVFCWLLQASLFDIFVSSWPSGIMHGKTRELLVQELAGPVVAARVRESLLRQVRMCPPATHLLHSCCTTFSIVAGGSEGGLAWLQQQVGCGRRVLTLLSGPALSLHRLVSGSEVKAFDEMMQEAAKKHLGLDVSFCTLSAQCWCSSKHE